MGGEEQGRVRNALRTSICMYSMVLVHGKAYEAGKHVSIAQYNHVNIQRFSVKLKFHNFEELLVQYTV